MVFGNDGELIEPFVSSDSALRRFSKLLLNIRYPLKKLHVIYMPGLTKHLSFICVLYLLRISNQGVHARVAALVEQ